MNEEDLIFGNLPGRRRRRSAEDDDARGFRERLWFEEQGPLPRRRGGSAPATNLPPANLTAPVVSGSVAVGSVLSTTNGAWTGSPTFAYQWLRGGANIAGATSSTYTTVVADSGTTVSCRVTATNSHGSASAVSNGVAVITPPSTWSASDAAANGMVLSNAGATLTVTNSALVNVWQIVRISSSKTSGKLYIEFSTSTGLAVAGHVGMANATVNINSYTGASLYSFGWGWVTGAIFTDGFTTGPSSSPSGDAFANDVFALAVDFSAAPNPLVFIARNNVWNDGGNPTTSSNPIASFVLASTGAVFPAMAFTNSAPSSVWTIQPTAATQKYAPPSGFSAWG